MYERFTDRARKAMQLANQEAQRFNHEYIGTEHILLGLAKERFGVAANILNSLEVDLPKLREEVSKLTPSTPGMVRTGKLPWTPGARKVIEHAIDEARNLNDEHVGTEHVLLGLLCEVEELGARVLLGVGCDLQRLRAYVLAYRDCAHLQPSSNLDSWLCARKTKRGVVREYDLFVPLHYNDGTPVERDKLARLRQRLVDEFGGLIDLHHQHKGYWKIGGVTFRDEIVIYRALVDDAAEARRFFRELKEELTVDLRQEDVLIVERQVEVL
jgi:hypothetical protein